MRKTRSKSPSSVKGTRLQLRLRPDQKAVLVRAAKLCRKTLSTFMLEHAYEAAQQVLADQVDIVMPPAEWQAFCNALDAPPRSIPAIQKLFSEAGAFDGERKATAE
jgi:uncharacterized protein (DUF1778 family)